MQAMKPKISKELKKKILIGHFWMFGAMIFGIVPLFFTLEYFVEKEAIAYKLTPIFVYFFYLYLLIFIRSKLESGLVEHIHDGYADQVKTMPSQYLTSAIIGKGFVPYVMPKILTKIVFNNELWDDEVLHINYPEVLQKTHTGSVKDIKQNYEKLTKEERSIITEKFVLLVASKVMNMPPEATLRSIGVK